jgi:prevent-host-death family protein
MREIGVGELRATLSKVLRRVEKGERFRVTVRGRPVADLVPATPAGSERYSEHMRRLIAEGRVTPASRSGPLPEGPPPRYTGKSATAIVLADREEER